MSQKPVCLKCACYFHIHKNGVWYIEQMPAGGKRPAIGNAEPENWVPYKLWHADLWICPCCGHELIAGSGQMPMAEHYQDRFIKEVEALGDQIIVLVNDC